MSKYIFVTGGVVSGLGKGITISSIGMLLKSSGFSVDVCKFDPYLNIDPGTMSPFEHGEVFVLNDGSECDLDLGHYERFLEIDLNKNSSVSAGKIYSNLLEKERLGQFLGKTVQTIPHVTNDIKDRFYGDKKVDFRLIEIGGTVGDIEGEVFLESLRQFRQQNVGKVFHIHLGYIPFLECSGEYKTKPFQSSLRDLLRSGMQPDMLVARYVLKSEKLSSNLLEKLALFGNLRPTNIIALPDLASIYAVPKYLLHKTGLIENLQEFAESKFVPVLTDFYNQESKPQSLDSIKIGIIGKYSKLNDADYSLIQSIKIAGFYNNIQTEIVFISPEELEQNNSTTYQQLAQVRAIVVPGGFGIRGMQGKILAAKYARENKIPYLGLCLGLQMAVVEFAKNVCCLDAWSREMDEDNERLETREYIIDFLPDQEKKIYKGASMRLGSYACVLQPDTLIYDLFEQAEITQFGKVVYERHRHRLEVQNKYVEILQQNGLIISGKYYQDLSEQNQEFLVEMIELKKEIHPYFVATQSHPEFLSRPNQAHPLFFGLVKAAKG